MTDIDPLLKIAALEHVLEYDVQGDGQWSAHVPPERTGPHEGIDRVSSAILCDVDPHEPQESAQAVGDSRPAAETDAQGQYVSFGKFESTSSGLYVLPEDEDEQRLFVCDAIRLVARTRDAEGGGWGLLVQWSDPDGRKHELDVPQALLSESGEPIRKVLMERGLRVATSKRSRDNLTAYLAMVQVDDRRTVVTRTGWVGSDFVTPARIYTSAKTDILFRPASDAAVQMRLSGSLAGWQNSVARYAVGNSRLMLALGCAFAAPMLTKLGETGGGFHFRAESSTGKTVLLKAAASVVSGREFITTWKATANGLEGIAAARNDLLLILDEIGESDGREAKNIVYMLANGLGKVRANRFGDARPISRWNLMFLSSGEVSLADKAADDRYARNSETKAGQEVRMLDIPAAAAFGVHDTLHGFESGRDLSDAILSGSQSHYGIPFLTFMERLVGFDKHAWDVTIDRVNARRDELLDGRTEGQISRAARRFAVVAVACELASEFGVAPWSSSDAFSGIRSCFDAWLTERGGPRPIESMQAVRRVRDFITRHPDRFEPIEFPHNVANRAGFRIGAADSDVVYAFTADGFRSAIGDLNVSLAARELASLGYLDGPGRDGKWSRVRKVATETFRCYHVRSSILTAE